MTRFQSVENSRDSRFLCGRTLGAVLFCLLTWTDLSAQDSAALHVSPFDRWANSEISRCQTRIQSIQGQLSLMPEFELSNVLRAGYHSPFYADLPESIWVQIDLGSSYAVSSVAIVPAIVESRSENGRPYGFPRRFQISGSNEPEFHRPFVVADYTAADFPIKGNAPALIDDLDFTARYLRLTCTVTDKNRQGYFMALSELMVFSDGANVAAWSPVATSGSTEAGLRWSSLNLVDQISPLPVREGLRPSLTDGFRATKKRGAPQWMQFDLQAAHEIDQIRLFPASPANAPQTPGWGFPMRFSVSVSDDPNFSTSEAVYEAKDLRHWSDAEKVISAKARLFFAGRVDRRWDDLRTPLSGYPSSPLIGRYVRIILNTGDTRFAESPWAFSEVEITSQGRNIAPNAKISLSDPTSMATPQNDRWSVKYLVDGDTSKRKIMPQIEYLRQVRQRNWLLARVEDETQVLATEVTVARRRIAWLGGSTAALFFGATFVAFRRQRKRYRHQAELLREQISNDLHDDIGSNLSTIALLSQTALGNVGVDETTRQDLSEMRAIAIETGDAMRDVLWLIRSGNIPLVDVISQFRQTAHRMLPHLNIDFDEPVDVPPMRVGLSWRREVFLCFKEMLHNIVKHSEATVVRIAVSCSGSRMCLAVTDNGKGLQEDRHSGTGLVSLKDRAEKLGGQFAVVSENGTCATLDIPHPPAVKWR